MPGCLRVRARPTATSESARETFRHPRKRVIAASAKPGLRQGVKLPSPRQSYWGRPTCSSAASTVAPSRAPFGPRYLPRGPSFSATNGEAAGRKALRTLTQSALRHTAVSPSYDRQPSPPPTLWPSEAEPTSSRPLVSSRPPSASRLSLAGHPSAGCFRSCATRLPAASGEAPPPSSRGAARALAAMLR